MVCAATATAWCRNAGHMQPKCSQLKCSQQQTTQCLQVERARKKMGYRNKWSRREVDEDAQHVWPDPLRADPVVAIIGGRPPHCVRALLSTSSPLSTSTW